MVNIIHDELLIECPDNLLEQEMHWIQKSMEDAGAIFCKVVKLKAVPESGRYWIH